MTDAVAENRLRRAVARRGYELRKSKRRDPKAFDFGKFMIWDTRTDKAVKGDKPHDYAMTFHDVERWLAD